MDNSWEKQLIIKISIDLSEGFIEYYLDPIKHTYSYTYHKLNGPAIIDHDGSREWLIHNKLHNSNNPAVLTTNGYKEWWVNDKLIKRTKYE